MREVSVSAVLCFADTYRFKFNLAALTLGCMDPIPTLRIVSAWLCGRIVSQVGRSVILHWADVCRFKLGSTALTDGYVDPIAAFRRGFKWLHDVCML